MALYPCIFNVDTRRYVELCLSGFVVIPTPFQGSEPRPSRWVSLRLASGKNYGFELCSLCLGPSGARTPLTAQSHWAKKLSTFSFKTLLFGWFRIEPALFEFHHEPVFLTRLLEDPHRFFKIVRIHHFNFDHCVITAFIINRKLRRYYYNIIIPKVNRFLPANPS